MHGRLWSWIVVSCAATLPSAPPLRYALERDRSLLLLFNTLWASQQVAQGRKNVGIADGKMLEYHKMRWHRLDKQRALRLCAAAEQARQAVKDGARESEREESVSDCKAQGTGAQQLRDRAGFYVPHRWRRLISGEDGGEHFC